MKKVAISFSYSSNSMQSRGLRLIDHFIHFDHIYSMSDFNLPLCYSNKPDGNVPDSVSFFDDCLSKADILIFAIPEAAGHYSAAFKNAIDWLVTKSKFNSQLGQNYSITQSPIYVLSFTPVNVDAGHRHFPLTKFLLEEKLGASVRQMHVFNQCWDYLIPQNFDFVKKQALQILNDIEKLPNKELPSFQNSGLNANRWQDQYNLWNEQWMKS